MKIIPDDKLTEEKETKDIKPRRAYRCACGLISLREQAKKIQGKYYCPCGGEAVEITDTNEGIYVLENIRSWNEKEH